MAKEQKGSSTRYIIHDTLEVYLKEKTKCGDGKVYFFGWTTEGNVTRAISQEPIKAGIHNKVVAMLQTDDGMTFSATTGVHYEEVMEVQMGSKFEELGVTVQEVVEDADGNFVATEKEVTGQVMDLNAEQLPKNYEVQLRGIAIDPSTNKPVSEVYWLFDQATPDGNLSEMFSAGSNKTQEMTFTCQVPSGSSSYGKYVIVPMEGEDEECELGE